jgi:hypothetical protein
MFIIQHGIERFNNIIRMHADDIRKDARTYYGTLITPLIIDEINNTSNEIIIRESIKWKMFRYCW